MDGTLYRLDSEDGGFIGSSLQQKVDENTLLFISEYEPCDLTQAKAILEESSIGTYSIFCQQRYNLESRKFFFDRVWNIDPTPIVKDFEVACQVIRDLKSAGNRLILVTAAPTVWQKRVIDFLGLTDQFDRVLTGEMFGLKEEVFKMLAEEVGTSSAISIGDQLNTDIEPAKKLGFQTLHVQKGDDLKTLLTNLNK